MGSLFEAHVHFVKQETVEKTLGENEIPGELENPKWGYVVCYYYVPEINKNQLSQVETFILKTLR